MKSPLQKQREIPPLRRPTISQERKGKKKSACSGRDDSGWWVGREGKGSNCPFSGLPASILRQSRVVDLIYPSPR